MKLPRLIDADDVGILALATTVVVFAACTVVVLAFAFGLAWAVFRVMGGM